MRKAAIGDTVHVHYKGTLEDGAEFDNSQGRDPLEVTLGQKQVIPGFEDAIVGMTEGETKSVTLEPDEAYGPRVPELMHTVSRTEIPPEVDLQVGSTVQASDGEGRHLHLIVVRLTDEEVTLDANHPLAGMALTFELTLERIAA